MRRFPIALLLFVIMLPGCATMTAKQAHSPYRIAADGDIVWRGEYRFSPPPKPWLLVSLDEGDTAFAYLKVVSGEPLCQSTFAYSEEPFGVSRNLRQRMKEFYRRFLWAGRVTFDPPRTRPVTVFGREALEATSLGRDPARGEKVWTKVILARRGERLVAFFMTQWQPTNGTFDRDEEKIFQRFIDSFRFLKPSFYQTL